MTGRTIKSNPLGNCRAKKHFWVPPPALTTPAQVPIQNPAKNKPRPIAAAAIGSGIRLMATIDRPSESTLNDPKFIEQLAALLDEIRQIKTEASRQRNHQVDGRANKKPPYVHTLSDKEQYVRRKSLELFKEELLKGIGNSSDKHSSLVDKLKQIEEDAGIAIGHVTSLRRYIEQLGQEDKMKSGDSASRVEKSKELMNKLSRLDDANRSLQNLIGGISSIDEPRVVNVKHASNQSCDKIEKQKIEIRNLQGQLEANRQEIINLKSALTGAISSSNAEKMSLKNEIRAHRASANKYLSDFDSVKLELNKKNEKLSDARMELENKSLCTKQLSNEISRLKLENGTLKSKLDVLECQLRADDAIVRTKMNEMESNFQKISSKATLIELENDKLQLTLAGMQTMVSKQKSEIERLENSLKETLKFPVDSTFNVSSRKKKSDSVEQKRDDSIIDKSTGDHQQTPVSTSQTDENKWIKVTELNEIVEKEKSAILNQLKDLEIKLELCEVSNQAFRKELTEKEEIMLENNLKLQDRISESNALKESLEVALNDVRKFTAQTTILNNDRATREKLDQLEAAVLRCRLENEQIRKQKDQMERKLTSEIDELRALLESVRSSNRTLQEYIKFLRNSYADVFGDRFHRPTTEL